MSKSQLESNVEFNSEELEVMKIVEKRNIIMAIDFESRTAEQKQELEAERERERNVYCGHFIFRGKKYESLGYLEREERSLIYM